MEPDQQDSEREIRSRNRLEVIRKYMDQILNLIEEEEEDGGRCRELSLVRTEQQSARHWLKDIGDDRAFAH